MKHLTPLTRLKVLLALALLLLCTVGGVSAKYITTLNQSSTVTFTAELAKTFVLQEHVANRADDGTYSLSTTETTTDPQIYNLIPGLDIPKDPHVVITGKTDIPAYLYIEIVDATDVYNNNTPDNPNDDINLVGYKVTEDWKAVDSSTVKAEGHGGTFYVYTDGASADNPVVLNDKTEGLSGIYILEGNTVYVSQHVKHADITANDDTDVLTFYAYLIEVT